MKFLGICSIFLLLVLFTRYDEIHGLDSFCGNWSTFKDEKCFTILDDTPRSFADAEKECSKLESGSTLAMIHSKDEQDYLSNYLFQTSKKVGNFWLAAKVVNSKVVWIDSSTLGYTNWDSKAPRNKPNYCVQIEYDEAVVGKWIDEPCETKNLVVCQKIQSLSMEKLHKMFLDLRKESKDASDEANKQIANLKQMLEDEKSAIKNISEFKQNPIPIGFIYTQLPNERSPREIWPSMTWTDVSTNYGGVFFRVIGGGSESIGQIQEENDRTLVRVESSLDRGSSVYDTIILNTTKQNTETSDWIYTGIEHTPYDHVLHVRFVVRTGEVRPRNMAMRVWKRTS